MKEELIRVLNAKLDNINSDINSLKELNNKIDEESESLGFVDSIINVFKENNENNPLNFDKIDKDDFSRALDITGDAVKNLFNSSACNYDGLVYLISGIKNGVSISLTNEQMNGIEYLIQSLNDKKSEFDTRIKELENDKTKYEISDINELKTKKEKYEKVIDEINKNEYINDIELLKEAISFSSLPADQTINILSYILEYNANLFKEQKALAKVKEEAKEEKQEIVENDDNKEKEDLKESLDEEVEETEFHFNQIENDNLFELPNITFDDKPSEDTVIENQPETINQEPITFDDNEVKEEEPQEINFPEEVEDFSEIEPNVEEPATSLLDNNEIVKEEDTSKDQYTPIVDIPVVTNDISDIKEETIAPVVEETDTSNIVNNQDEALVTPFETVNVTVNEQANNENAIDNDFKDVISGHRDYENNSAKEEEKMSTRELHKVFSKYGIEENIALNELVDGDVNEYQNTLNTLKTHDLLGTIKRSKELLIETLLYSNTNIIEKVLRIVKEDLSVDDEDYQITLKIVANTIPSIFIDEGGNYNNFVKNVDLFKKLEINLINLFDFSKEIFVADHERIEKNLAIVNKYDFDINYKNAKYFLLIPNIEDKMDYYIESVYQDKVKNATFDGIEYIKEFTAKLNVVTDETIKRLRYASLNGKKVFGNKPGSLTGEITNLKVNALDLNSEYLNSFFNNQFIGITPEEVRQYDKLIHSSSNVGDYSDELEKLNSYRVGLRYTIEGINISYNKVLRNYSVLRSYGIDFKKALQFAVCYNLVITKDEYNKLNDFLNKIGGNI